MSKRVHFLCNGVYTSKVGGGDIHMIHLARAALARGYAVNFFGGHALQRQLEPQLTGHTITLTDRAALPSFNDSAVTGQLRMFVDYTRRLSGTLKQLALIGPADVAYGVGDFWYDVIPLVRSRCPERKGVGPEYCTVSFRWTHDNCKNLPFEDRAPNLRGQYPKTSGFLGESSLRPE